jgi:hypothetical protein
VQASSSLIFFWPTTIVWSGRSLRLDMETHEGNLRVQGAPPVHNGARGDEVFVRQIFERVVPALGG